MENEEECGHIEEYLSRELDSQPNVVFDLYSNCSELDDMYELFIRVRL